MTLLEPPKEILSILRNSLPDSLSNLEPEDTSGSEEILAYVAFLAAGLCEVQDFTPSAWADALKPYFSDLQGCDDNETIEKFREASEKATMGVDDADSYGDHDDDTFEEVCNIKFK
jgi:hypothetical protein